MLQQNGQDAMCGRGLKLTKLHPVSWNYSRPRDVFPEHSLAMATAAVVEPMDCAASVVSCGSEE